MRVAIVHDTLVQFGGAERVLLALMEAFPHAPVYTSLYSPTIGRFMATHSRHFDERRIRSTFLQRIPFATRRHHYFPLLMPLAMEQFNFDQYDVVLSDTYSFAKGVVTGPQTMHLSYCFTPTRYVWDDCHSYVRDFTRLAPFLRLAPLGLSYIRLWDYFAAQRVDSYVTLSHFVARRIKKYYQRDSSIVPPPVDVSRYSVAARAGSYYLVVARLVPYKRIDLAIAACERLGRRLKVVGTGPELKALKAKAGPMTEFVGFVPDEELPDLYAGAKALLFPQEEDFGITPLEAAAAGRPTIAYASGGALETIQADITGVFFSEQTVDSLVDAIERFEGQSFDMAKIRQHAEQFATPAFVARMREAVDTEWQVYRTSHATRV